MKALHRKTPLGKQFFKHDSTVQIPAFLCNADEP
jgi:hypothetical protein